MHDQSLIRDSKLGKVLLCDIQVGEERRLLACSGLGRMSFAARGKRRTRL